MEKKWVLYKVLGPGRVEIEHVEEDREVMLEYMKERGYSCTGEEAPLYQLREDFLDE